MKAIILAAGLGTRLLPLTREKPKALFPIVNRPIIDIIINNLKGAGVDSVGINLHHLADQIIEHLKFGKKHEVDIKYIYEDNILDTGGGLANFADFIGDDPCFIVHNCDILTDVNLPDVLTFHQDLNPAATLITVDNPPYNSLLIDRYNRIKDIGGKLGVAPKRGDRKLCAAGVFVYSNSIFDWLPKRKHPYPLVPYLVKMLAKNPGSILSYPADREFFWKDIGNTVKYIEAHRDLLIDKKARFYGVFLPDNGIWIDRSANVSPQAQLKGFVSVGREAEVGGGAKLEDCILWDRAVAPGGVDHKNAVITDSIFVKG